MAIKEIIMRAFIGVVAVLLLACLVSYYVNKARAQTQNKYHFECIASGFTSQQCTFLGLMLRRYGIE